APPSPLPRRSRRRPCPDRHRTSGDAATDALQGAAGTVRGDGTGTARADLLAGTPASPPPVGPGRSAADPGASPPLRRRPGGRSGGDGPSPSDLRAPGGRCAAPPAPRPPASPPLGATPRSP